MRSLKLLSLIPAVFACESELIEPKINIGEARTYYDEIRFEALVRGYDLDASIMELTIKISDNYNEHHGWFTGGKIIIISSEKWNNLENDMRLILIAHELGHFFQVTEHMSFEENPIMSSGLSEIKTVQFTFNQYQRREWWDKYFAHLKDNLIKN